MGIKRFTEKDLLKGLNETTAHADELAQPLSQEIEPLEKLRGSVTHYERHFDGFSDDLFDDRAQPSSVK